MAVLLAQDVLSMASVLWLSAAVRLPLPLLAAPPGELWKATARGFEPLRAEPNGFPVHLLSRSDTLSWLKAKTLTRYCQGQVFLRVSCQDTTMPHMASTDLARGYRCVPVCAHATRRCAHNIQMPQTGNLRQRGDSNPCGQSPMDFESISLAARTDRLA